MLVAAGGDLLRSAAGSQKVAVEPGLGVRYAESDQLPAVQVAASGQIVFVPLSVRVLFGRLCLGALRSGECQHSGVRWNGM